MKNTFVDDVKLIAKVDGLKTGLDRPAEKQPIKGRRGIAFINPDGTVGSSSGEKGSALPPDDANGGSAAEETTGAGAGGNTSGTGVTINQDQDGSQTDEDGTKYGTVDASQLFDGTLGLGDSFTGLDFYPCDDPGQKYTIRYDGQFTAPEGWEDAETPPNHDEYLYEPGVYWSVDPTGDYRANTAHASLMLWYAAFVTAFNTPPSGLGTVGWSISGETISGQEGVLYSIIVDATDQDGAAQPALGAAYVSPHNCGAIELDYCTLPPEYKWPSNSPAQLTWDADKGAFITSPYDTNVADKYKANNVGELHLCDKNGNPIWTAPAKDGGHVLTYPANNHFVVVGPDGKVKAAGSGSARDSYVAGGTTLP